MPNTKCVPRVAEKRNSPLSFKKREYNSLGSTILFKLDKNTRDDPKNVDLSLQSECVSCQSVTKV